MSCPFGVIETGSGSFLATKKKLQFDELVGYLKVSFSLLPDYRQGFNKIFHIQDAALSAFWPSVYVGTVFGQHFSLSSKFNVYYQNIITI